MLDTIHTHTTAIAMRETKEKKMSNTMSDDSGPKVTGKEIQAELRRDALGRVDWAARANNLLDSLCEPGTCGHGPMNAAVHISTEMTRLFQIGCAISRTDPRAADALDSVLALLAGAHSRLDAALCLIAEDALAADNEAAT